MPHILPRLVTIAIGATVILAVGGCTRIKDHKGYVIDKTLVDTVQAGIDNRDSVSKTLGRPSFASQFDGGQSWYYVARDTHQLAFAMPRPVQQTILAVNFDARGNVVSVNKTGMDKVVKVRPYGPRTPTLGRHRGFFQELFGNIGTVGAAGMGGSTTDNPQ